jgi:opacity protein-like surface antigen
MKKIAFVTMIAAAAAFASPADAQVRPFQISIAGGPSFPTGHLSDEAGTGYNVQGSVGFGVRGLPFGLRADLLWQEFPLTGVDGHFRQIGGLLNATFALPLPFMQPYLLAGAGLINHSEPETVHGGHRHDGSSSTDIGFNAGGGVQFPFAGMSGFVEAKYLNIVGGNEDARSIPVSIGIRF